jgi:hypothetical protein
MLMTADDIRTLSTSDLLRVILKLSASEVIAGTLQFHTIESRDPIRTRLSAENATYYTAALRLIEGKFGIQTGKGNICDWRFGSALLGNYLEYLLPDIWDCLPQEIQHALSLGVNLTSEIIMGIMKIAMSPTRLINLLISEKYSGFTDLLIEKYLAERNVREYNYSITSRKKQIVADIFQENGLLVQQ